MVPGGVRSHARRDAPCLSTRQTRKLANAGLWLAPSFAGRAGQEAMRPPSRGLPRPAPLRSRGRRCIGRLRRRADPSAPQLLDAAGRRRSPATMPEFHAARAPGNKGQRYAAEPPTVDEIITVMRHARARPVRQPPQWADRRALARRAPHQRGALAQRDGSRRTPRVDPGQARQERSPPPGRDGRVGLVSHRSFCRRPTGRALWRRVDRARFASYSWARFRSPMRVWASHHQSRVPARRPAYL